MSNFTFATVAVAASDQAAAQASYPEYFCTAASETGEAPATHYITSGPFDDVELAAILNSQDWPKRVAFGQDAFAGLQQLGLVLVQYQQDIQQEIL